MHGVELVGLDLDAAARQLAFDRDRLEPALGKLRLQRLLVDARHWSAMCGPEFPPRIIQAPDTRAQWWANPQSIRTRRSTMCFPSRRNSWVCRPRSDGPERPICRVR